MLKKENKKYCSSFFFGGLSSLAFAPLFIFPALWISFTYLLLSIDKNKGLNNKSSFFLGWWFGFGHFIVGTYWICSSLLVEPEKFAWLIPFAISIIPGFLALFIAIPFFITFYLAKKLKLRKMDVIVLFAVLWSFSEILRSFIFTGFPWNLIGYVWGFSDKMIQITSVVGAYGLGFFTMIIFSCPFLLFSEKKASYKKAKKDSKSLFSLRKFQLIVSKNELVSFFICITLLPSIYFYGHIRLESEKYLLDTGKIARIVQPNISQSEKWDFNSKFFTLKKIMEKASYDSNSVDYLILPEVAIPYIINDNAKLLEFIKKMFPENIKLVTGGLRAEYEKNQEGGSEISKLWNSVFVIQNGEILGYYDKMHLVPFGEYIPFRRFIPFIKKITYGNIDFSRGEKRKVVQLDKELNARFLVCYEAIFPNEILGYEKKAPNIIVNLTNDAWFGTTSGPYQHLTSVKFRAVEYGIPIIRSANTGISAYINSYGKIVDKTNLNVENYFDIEINGKLDNTVYLIYNKYIILFFLYFLGIVIVSNKNNLNNSSA